MNSADIPMQISYQGTPILNAARLAVIVAVLTSAPWAYLVQQERNTSERLLAAKLAQEMKIAHVVVQFSNGIVDKLSTGAE